MKRIVKILLFVVLTWLCLINLRNLYLYFSYSHGQSALLKEAEHKWRGVFETWFHGVDEKHELEISLNGSDLGTFVYKYYTKKIGASSANTYSWTALLPYEKPEVYTCSVSLDSVFIVFYPGEQSLWSDTVYAKYRLSADSLFIDRHPQGTRYESLPDWGLEYSEKPSIISIIFPINVFL